MTARMLTVFAFAALPAAAPASVTTPSIKVTKGYRLVLNATRKHTTITLVKAGQAHRLVVSRGLKRHRLHFHLNGYGSLRLTVKKAKGKGRAAVPKGCTGSTRRGRRAVLKGLFKVKLGHTTIKRRRLKAVLATPKVRRCGSRVTAGVVLAAPRAGVAVVLAGSRTAEQVVRRRTSGRTKLTSTITATTTSRAFVTAADLHAAAAQGVGPFVSGTLVYQSKGSSTTRTTGTIAKSWSAVFDFFGAQTVPSGTPATLARLHGTSL